MRGEMKQFFELPLEEKQRYARPIDDMEGYGADTYVSEDRVLDWTDRMEKFHQYSDARNTPSHAQGYGSVLARLNMSWSFILIQMDPPLQWCFKINKLKAFKSSKMINDLRCLLTLIPSLSTSAINWSSCCTQIMSNGIFRSPLHRVVTHADKERMTLGMFCYPDQENELITTMKRCHPGQAQTCFSCVLDEST
ncbi:hypothetical protein V2J09_002970 [Rumex salicifolius]